VDQVVAQTRGGVTAWVTVSDAIGYTWVQHWQTGLRIPQDVRLRRGRDRWPGGLPRLTSVAGPFEADGKGGNPVLVNRINILTSPIQRLVLKSNRLARRPVL